MHRTSSSSTPPAPSRRGHVDDRGEDPLGPVAGPTRGAVRLLRTGVLSGSSLLLAVVAHALGGGPPPGVRTILLLACVTAAVALAATAQRCRLSFLLPLLGAEQLLLHLLLPAAGPAACAGPGGTMPAGHLGTLPCAALADGSAADQPGGPGMLAAHAVATALTAWLLTRGEAALWRLADHVVRAALPALAVLPPLRRPVRAHASRPAPHPVTLAEDAAPRGPPVLAPAAG